MPSIYLVAHIPEHVPDDYDPLESQPVHEVAPHPRDTVVVGEWLPLTGKQLDDVLTGRDIHAPVCREVALKGHRFTTRYRMEHPRGPIDVVIFAEDAETAEHAFIGLLITSAWSTAPWVRWTCPRCQEPARCRVCGKEASHMDVHTLGHRHLCNLHKDSHLCVRAYVHDCQCTECKARPEHETRGWKPEG